jgi:alkylhydroperoxidase family enzyme
MARIQGVEPGEAGLLTRFRFWMTKRRLGHVILPFRITAHQPRLLRAIGAMEMGQRAMETIEPKLKALAAIKTALLIGCPFSFDIGSAAGRQSGVSASQLAALPDFEDAAEFSGTEKLVLRYAVALTNTPVEISEDLFQALKRIFDERQLVELTSAIAWENYRARFNRAFGIESEGFYKGAFCLLAPARHASAARHS